MILIGCLLYYYKLVRTYTLSFTRQYVTLIVHLSFCLQTYQDKQDKHANYRERTTTTRVKPTSRVFVCH